jgi:MFS family permease
MNGIAQDAVRAEQTLAQAIGPTATTWLIQVIMALSMLAVPTLAPEIAADVGVDATLVGGFATLLWLAAIASSLVAGPLITKWGPLRMGQVCLVLYAAGLASAAQGSLALLALCAIGVGFGCGPETPSSSALLARVAPTRWRSLVFSAKQTGMQAGGMAAGFLFPLLALALDWRHVMAVTALTALATAVLVEPLRRRYDHLARERADAAQIGFGAALYVVWRSSALRRLAFTGFAFCAMQISLNTFMVTYGVVALGYNLALAGTMLALAQAGGLVGRILWGILAGSCVSAPTMMFSLGLVMTLTALIFGLARPDWPVSFILILAVVFGLTASGWNGVMLAEMTHQTPAASLGPVMGAMMAFGYLGLVVGPLVFSVAVAVSDLNGGFIALALLSLAGALAMLRLTSRARE